MGSHKKLTRDDRKCIETMIYDNKIIQELADRIGVRQTTIDRELKRVLEDLIYNADNAHIRCGTEEQCLRDEVQMYF